jgi:hypothetical protein
MVRPALQLEITGTTSKIQAPSTRETSRDGAQAKTSRVEGRGTRAKPKMGNTPLPLQGGERTVARSNVQRSTSNIERRTSNVEHRTSNIEHRTSNIEHRTSNIEHRTSNIEHRTSNIEHRTSNIEHRTSNRVSQNARQEGSRGLGTRASAAFQASGLMTFSPKRSAGSKCRVLLVTKV